MSPRTFSLEAVVTPTTDERKVEREAESVRQKFDEKLSNLEADVGGVAGAGGGGMGVDTGGVGGIGGAGTAATAAGGASLLGGGVGSIAKKAVPVAAAGATFKAMSFAIQKLADASPALSAVQAELRWARRNFLQPVGKLLAEKLSPISEAVVSLSSTFRDNVESDGLAIATGKLAAEIGRELNPFSLREQAVGMLAREIEDFDIPGRVDSLFGEIESDWPGWPDGLSAFPGWPDIPEPTVDFAVEVGVDITGSIQEFFESRVDVNPIVNEIEADLSEVNDPVDTDPFGGDDDDDGGGGGEFGDGSDDDIPGGASGPDRSGSGRTGRGDFRGDTGDIIGIDSGGAVRSGGMARVHSGERVLPEAQVSDRGEADLAQGDEITRLLRQIRRELARQDSGRDDAVVQELRQIRREVTGGDGRSRLSNRDAVDALERLADRYGADL